MTATAFSQARVLFDDALLALQQGQPEAAERDLLACLQLMPGRVSPLVALGAARLRLNRAPEALLALDEALAQDPTRSDAWGHCADALLRLGRPAEALQALDRAEAAEAATTWHRAQALNALGRHAEALPLLDKLLAQDDNHAATWLDRARTLQCLGRHAEAGPAYQRAVQADPTLGPAWSLRGQWLKDQGQWVAAQDAFERALALGDDPELNRWFLVALATLAAPIAPGASAAAPANPALSTPSAVPSKPPDHYVQQLFDGYAAEFDHQLVQDLGYQAPQRLALMLAIDPPRPRGPALDLGCGTGLCARVLQAQATVVDGVDLSGAMLQRARSLAVYRHLHQAELVQHLQTTPERYALLLAADVLIYIGDLQALFSAARRVLMPGGLFAFSLEEAADTVDFELRASLRYAHSHSYLLKLAANTGLRMQQVQRAPLRLHEGQPLLGLYALLCVQA